MTNKTALSQFVSACVAEQMSYRAACDEFRRAWLEEALKRNGKNQCALAEEMGVHRNTLGRMITSLRVQIPDGKRRHHAQQRNFL